LSITYKLLELIALYSLSNILLISVSKILVILTCCSIYCLFVALVIGWMFFLMKLPSMISLVFLLETSLAVVLVLLSESMSLLFMGSLLVFWALLPCSLALLCNIFMTVDIIINFNDDGLVGYFI
jgi:hypothetical protein